jgi:hypothetical protein
LFRAKVLPKVYNLTEDKPETCLGTGGRVNARRPTSVSESDNVMATLSVLSFSNHNNACQSVAAFSERNALNTYLLRYNSSIWQ